MSRFIEVAVFSIIALMFLAVACDFTGMEPDKLLLLFLLSAVIEGWLERRDNE